MSYFPMVFCVLVQSLCYLSALFVDEWESTRRHLVTLFMLYFVDLLFQATDALHVEMDVVRELEGLEGCLGSMKKV